MQTYSDRRRQKLAQISQRACEIVQRVDENLTDVISLMDLSLSLDGLGELYNDLGRPCDLSKIAKIPGKCIDLAMRLADEVSSDWLGLDPVSENSEEMTSHNSESESEEELDEYSDSQLREELNEDSESQIEEELDENSVSQLEEELDEISEAQLEQVFNESKEDLDDNAQSESNDNNDDLPTSGVTCHSESTVGDKLSNQESEVKPALVDENFPETVLEDATPEVLSSQVDVLPIEAHVNLNAPVEVSQSHGGNSKVDRIDKTDETTDEADNLVNFSKPLEYGEFEDINLTDDWEDDIDYDLDVVSFHQPKKSSKNKLAAKFISRLRRTKKSQLSEVADKAEASTADSDWEIV